MTEKQIENAVALLQEGFLFQNVQQATIKAAVSDTRCEQITFAQNDVIYSPLQFKKSLGMFVLGSAVVQKESKNKMIVLSRLKKGDYFGAITLFSNLPEYATTIVAEKACEVLFIPETLIKQLLEQNFVMVENYIRYLSSRIRFLNQRIDTFTGGNAEEKLVIYLQQLAIEQNSSTLELPFQLTMLADVLSISRASLYRALESLEKEKLIKRNGRKIKIEDQQGLFTVIEHSAI